MAEIDVHKLEQIIQQLDRHIQEAKGLAAGVAAFVTNIPGAETVDPVKAKATASDLIGFGYGLGDVKARSSQVIDAIHSLSKK